MNHRRFRFAARVGFADALEPASVRIRTQVQCGQNGASSREFQKTVSMPTIFMGRAAPNSGSAAAMEPRRWRLDQFVVVEFRHGFDANALSYARRIDKVRCFGCYTAPCNSQPSPKGARRLTVGCEKMTVESPLVEMAATSLKFRDIESSTLSNGVRVITEMMPHVRSVSMGIWIDSGSRGESAEENGISHFIEHMVFKGTSQPLRGRHCPVGGFGGRRPGRVHVEGVGELQHQGTRRAHADRFRCAFGPRAQSLFREGDIEKEKGVILEELKMEVDNPEYLIHEIFSSNFWKDHPLGKPILGTRETVKRFHRDMLREFFRRTYAPSNILITAAGHLSHEQIVRIGRGAVRRARTDAYAPATHPPKPHARLIFRNKSSLEQVHVYMGVPAYALPHEARFVCYVLNTVLGGGMSSRLFQNIREKQGLAYSVYSELSMYRDAGCMAICAGTSVESAR
jgi:hypothetical protein